MKEDIYTFIQKDENSRLIVLSICGITYPDKNYVISRPNSDVACIEYIEKGAGTVNIGKNTFYPSEGDSYFLHNGFDQYYYSDANTPWEKYFINICGPLLSSLIDGYNLTNKFYFSGLNLKAELLEIIELAKSGSCDHTEEIILILNKIFYKMRNRLANLPPHTPALEMKNYLNTKIDSDFKISELCSLISKSESQTIKIFKKAYGITPYQYLLTKRLELAKNLLENSNLSIKEISAKLCFADEYYFSNIFKKKSGMNPSEYRKASAAYSR